MNFDYLRHETLGYGSFMDGPYGKRLVTYADYTASGKSLRFLENYYLKLSETYANTHTEDDYTGKRTTELYHDAKTKIRNCVGANSNFCVFPAGTGATGAIEKLTKILGVYKTPEFWRQRNECLEKFLLNRAEKGVIKNFEYEFELTRPVVFISSYEHHSNEVMWREGHAEVVKIGLDNKGLFDVEALRELVSSPKYKNRKKIGSFSASSNVTGIKTPVYEVARIMHQHGGVVFFDFAASGPYVEINMTKDEESYFDGIYLSMHKFLGGPGASGLLILNKDVYCGGNTPCSTGGGTVKYVTHDDHRYLMDYEDREDAGTPGIMQVIRAAMALELKDTLGSAEIERVELDYIRRAFDALGKVENIDILGNNDPEKRIAIMSFNIRYKNGYLHHGFVSTLLNDLFGIQSRAGCACAGPYGIEILNIDEKRVNRFKEIIDAGIDSMKPGWSRINFHYTFDKATFDYIIDAIKFVANYGHEFLGEYKVSCVKGTWEHRDSVEAEHAELSILKALLGKRETLKTKKMNYGKLYKKYMKLAQKTRLTLQSNEKKHVLFSDEMFADIAWFYHAEVGV